MTAQRDPLNFNTKRRKKQLKHRKKHITRKVNIHSVFAYCACAYSESELFDLLILSFPSNYRDLVPVLIPHSITILMSYSIKSTECCDFVLHKCCDFVLHKWFPNTVHRLHIPRKRQTGNNKKKQRSIPRTWAMTNSRKAFT